MSGMLQCPANGGAGLASHPSVLIERLCDTQCCVHQAAQQGHRLCSQESWFSWLRRRQVSGAPPGCPHVSEAQREAQSLPSSPPDALRQHGETCSGHAWPRDRHATLARYQPGKAAAYSFGHSSAALPGVGAVVRMVLVLGGGASALRAPLPGLHGGPAAQPCPAAAGPRPAGSAAVALGCRWAKPWLGAGRGGAGEAGLGMAPADSAVCRLSPPSRPFLRPLACPQQCVPACVCTAAMHAAAQRGPARRLAGCWLAPPP